MSFNKMSSKAVDKKLAKNEPDDRIACTNSAALDKILEMATKYANKTAESLPYESRSRLVTRFIEVYQEMLQQNVSVFSAPWHPTLSSPALAEQQLQESEDRSRSRLSDAVEGAAARRKATPKACSRILEMELKHSRQNLKMLEVDHPLPIPPPPHTSATTFCHQELAKVFEDMSCDQTKINALDEEILQLGNDYQETRRILVQPGNDSGYQSP